MNLFVELYYQYNIINAWKFLFIYEIIYDN